MAEILITLIWTIALGVSVGYYATSFVYRMPKGESPFTKHPYCGGCGTMLQVKDLYPAVSWLLLRGKCRYCSMEIPSVYFWTEVFTAVIFALGALSLGFNQSYVLLIIGGTCVVTLWALEYRVKQIFYSVLILIAAIGVINRTLLDGSIYPAAYGILWGAGIPMIWWRLRQPKDNLNGEKERIALPHSVALGATAGAWFGSFGLAVFVVVWVMLSLLYKAIAKRNTAWPADVETAPYSVALMLLAIYPQIIVAAETTLTALLAR